MTEHTSTSALTWLFDPRLLAVVLVGVSIAGLVVAYFVPNVYSLSFPIAILLGALTYPLLDSDTATREIEHQFDDRALLAIYFVVLAAIVTVYSIGGFRRGLAVHALTYLLYSVVVGALLAGGSVNVWAAAGVGTAAVHRLTVYYSSELYMGNDVFVHNRWAEAIALQGGLGPLNQGKYFYAPVYHVYAAVGDLVTGLPTRWAVGSVVVFAILLTSFLGIFLLTSQFWSGRFAAVAAVVFVGSDFAVNWGIQPQATSFGVLFFLLSFLCAVSYLRTYSTRSFGLFVVFVILTSFTHQVSLFISSVFVSLFVAGTGLYRLKFGLREFNVLGTIGLVFFLDSIVTRYFGPTGGDQTFFRNVILSFISSAEEGGSRPTGGQVSEVDLVLPGANALTIEHVAGVSILLFLAILGSLVWFGSRDTGPSTEQFAAGLGLILGVGFPLVLAGPIFGIRQILPWRWFVFLYTPLVVFAVVGLRSIVSTLSHRLYDRRTAVLAVFVCLLLPYFLFMGGNFRGAFDGPVFDEAHGAERFAVDSEEVAAMEFSAERFPDETLLLSDRVVAVALERYYGLNGLIVQYDAERGRLRTGDRTTIFISRPYTYTRQARYYFMTEHRIVETHGGVPEWNNDHNRIYDAGSVEANQLIS